MVLGTSSKFGAPIWIGKRDVWIELVHDFGGVECVQ
jgi:hypothetical protein